MEFPENLKNNSKSPEEKITEIIRRMGIGHMPENTPFSIDQIDPANRNEVIETYKLCTEKIEFLIGTLNSIITEANTENRSPEVFDDLLNGISDALYKTANQILYHSVANPEESLTAFDELTMIMESVNQSLNSPQILNKKKYPTSSVYGLSTLTDLESFEIKSFDTLFSKDHIAFNIASSPLYQDTGKTIKSGIRLDYGPLYKETKEGLDKTKTEWTVSVDVSGYYIDKIMNLYSSRGHHFTKMFEYKMNLLMKSFSEHMEKRLDKFSKQD